MRRKIDILSASIALVLTLETRADLLDQVNQRLSIRDPQNQFQLQLSGILDRGFDPWDSGPQLRLDEYFLRYTPLDNARVNFQIGKFATVVGSWVRRHDSWQNPFINAPLPYENITTVSDTEAPSSRQDF